MLKVYSIVYSLYSAKGHALFSRFRFCPRASTKAGMGNSPRGAARRPWNYLGITMLTLHGEEKKITRRSIIRPTVNEAV